MNGEQLTAEQKRIYGFIPLSAEDLRRLGIRSMKPELLRENRLTFLSTPTGGGYWPEKWRAQR